MGMVIYAGMTEDGASCDDAPSALAAPQRRYREDTAQDDEARVYQIQVT